MIDAKVAVCSRTFSKHPVLRQEIVEVFHEVVFNDAGIALEGESLVEHLNGCQGAIVALEPITDSVLNSLPELRAIAKYGVGLNNLDQAAMEKNQVRLGWTGGVNRRSVAELALAFILGIQRNVLASIELMRSGTWKNSGGFELSGKTVGIIGFGYIGSDLASLLQPFGVHILVNDILDKSIEASKFGGVQVEKIEVLRKSDIISLHVPYDQTTHHLIDERALEIMKDDAILVNTARGNIVDEAALFTALKNRGIRAAAFDVYAIEPPHDSPLFTCPSFFGTPHIGGSTKESVLAMGRAAIANLQALLMTLEVS